MPISQCPAFDDSPAGIEAALKTGITSVSITGYNLHGVDFPDVHHACFDFQSRLLFFYPPPSSQDKPFLQGR
jgi:beta-phosphoglucomutase-like phosphatase (HAD superfamily)